MAKIKTKTTLVRIPSSDLDQLDDFVHNNQVLPSGVHLTKTAVATWAVRFMLETLKGEPK